MIKDYRKLWAGLLFLVILSPLGLLAQGTAFGEWSADDLQQMLGFVPAGLAHDAGLWQYSPLPDYGLAGVNSTLGSIMGYLLSAVIGIVLIVGIVYLFSKMIKDEV
jgi:hypothetical protein